MYSFRSSAPNSAVQSLARQQWLPLPVHCRDHSVPLTTAPTPSGRVGGAQRPKLGSLPGLFPSIRCILKRSLAGRQGEPTFLGCSLGAGGTPWTTATGLSVPRTLRPSGGGCSRKLVVGSSGGGGGLAGRCPRELGRRWRLGG